MDIFKLNRHLCRLLRKKVKIKQTEGVATAADVFGRLKALSCSLRFSEFPEVPSTIWENVFQIARTGGGRAWGSHVR